MSTLPLLQPSFPYLRMLFLGPGPWRLFAWLRATPVLNGFAAPLCFPCSLTGWIADTSASLHFFCQALIFPTLSYRWKVLCILKAKLRLSHGLNPACKSPNEFSIQNHSSFSTVHFLRQIDPGCCWHGNCSVQGQFCSWLQIWVANKSSSSLISYLCKELVKRQLPSWFTTTCRWKPVLERILAAWKRLCIQIFFFAFIENCLGIYRTWGKKSDKICFYYYI